MSRGKKKKRILRVPKSNRPAVQTTEYILEHGTLQQMRDAKAKTELVLKYQWQYYSELALQRSQIQDEIRAALVGSCISDYSFSNWQRAVKWKYGLHPLSTIGSTTFVGQRFNTGRDVNAEAPSFPALYIAQDKDTALQETLGQIRDPEGRLSPREIALTNPQSEVIVSVSGQLEKVFDLRQDKYLASFLRLIKGFTTSAELKKLAAELGEPEPGVVRTTHQLLETILFDNWRLAPTNFDIPANSQIFGHLLYQAGIEGVIYPSKLTKKECLAIFPHNFLESSSFIELNDEPPTSSVPKRIDSSSWRLCDLSVDEL